MSRAPFAGVVLAAALLANIAAHAAPAAAARPFQTAVYANDGVSDMKLIPASGAGTIRLTLSWPSVAPKTKPAAWDPTDPFDPSYDWSSFDRLVQYADGH